MKALLTKHKKTTLFLLSFFLIACLPFQSALAVVLTDPGDPASWPGQIGFEGPLPTPDSSFPDGSGGTIYVYDEITFGNVTFTSHDPFDIWITQSYSQIGHIALQTGMDITFQTPVTDFIFLYFSSSTDPNFWQPQHWALNAYDENGDLLESNPLMEQIGFLGFSNENYGPNNYIYSASIDYIGPAGGEIWFGIDNFGYRPIPEPATMVLLGMGVAGLFGVKRKRF